MDPGLQIGELRAIARHGAVIDLRIPLLLGNALELALQRLFLPFAEQQRGLYHFEPSIPLLADLVDTGVGGAQLPGAPLERHGLGLALRLLAFPPFGLEPFPFPLLRRAFALLRGGRRGPDVPLAALVVEYAQLPVSGRGGGVVE